MKNWGVGGGLETEREREKEREREREERKKRKKKKERKKERKKETEGKREWEIYRFCVVYLFRSQNPFTNRII